MADAIVRFRSPRQPAHYVRVGHGFKFVGGGLVVRAEDADLVRAYALAHPSLGIVEVAAPRPPRKPKASEDEA